VAITGVGAVAGIAGTISCAGGRGLLNSAILFRLNAALAVTYMLLVAWGIFSAIMAVVNPDDTGFQVQVVSFVIVATIAHYSISIGGSAAVSGLKAYPIRPSLFRALDVAMLVAASTLIVFFLDTSNLFVVALGGSVVTTGVLAAQIYKVGVILQRDWSASRGEVTGKLLSVETY